MSKAVDFASMQRMATALAHRGPDGQGIFLSEKVGMVHTRLSIIDLEGGAQPLYNEDRTVVLVCNGEIYNHVELRDELVRLGHVFSTGSDSETLIHAYETWGLAFLERVRGMFAFALFDTRTREMLIARDRLGIKPLFVQESSDGIRFASELKALLTAGDRAPELNPTALLEYFQNQYSCAKQTMIAGITRLLPGEAAVMVDGRIVRRWRYYRLVMQERARASERELMEEFDDLMRNVMREHTRSDVPFGLFLSGGVDSSLLAVMLREYAPKLRTFSVGFHGDHDAEIAQARVVSSRLGTEHAELVLKPADLLSRLPFAVWASDELLGDPACLPTSLLSEHAGRELKVVFSGEGGDEVFGGYARYRASMVKRLLRLARAPALGGMRAQGQSAGFEAKLFGSELRALGKAWQQPQAAAWREFSDARSAIRRMQAVDMVTWLPDDLLAKCDRMMMGFALEGRVPYLDHRVVEFGLALKDGAKVGQGVGKLFLRRWGQRYLPGTHLWSRKKGFTVPIQACLTGAVLDALSIRLPRNEGVLRWFEPEEVQKLVRNVKSGRRGTRVVWALMQFAIWHRIFIEGGGQRPMANTAELSDML